MKIMISGHTGFIGSYLTGFFTNKGHHVQGISRQDFKQGLEHITNLIDGSDVVINLAGAPITKRWTKKYSKILWDSRILTTRMISNAIATATQRPSLFLSGSAVGIYADGGRHTESDFTYDDGFLGILCQRWEEEALRARIHCHTLIIRTGIVLGKNGGALPQMILPFKLYVGGKLGQGSQMISWIHIEDYAMAVEHLISRETATSVFNFTAPAPVSNALFSEKLAARLNRPNRFTVPGFALRLIYGEGSVALLSGQEVIPENLIKEGYNFRFKSLDDALDDLL
jgi:uncharacterized protein